MYFFKIDPALFSVHIASTQPTKSIVYVDDFKHSREYLQKMNVKILGEYPFIKAFAIESRSPIIFDLAQISWVNYISSVATAQIMMQNARKIIKVDELHRKGILGTGVGVAIIDTGCYPHLDFLIGKRRVTKFVDFVGSRQVMYDDNGHGTFVAGVLAGSGLGSAGLYRGIAPDCNLFILKALNNEGQTQAITVLDAMQWVFENRHKFNIKVVCMSFGSTPLARNDPLSIGAASLWDAGITVVSAAGNDGPKAGSVKSPASCSKIITVGCADTTGGEEKVADFSSRGPIFDIVKPDIIAPGVNITSLSNSPKMFTQMSGTSVSAPFVAGVVALLLQENPFLTPNQVKSIIMYSAKRLPFSPNDCGMGLLDATAASEY